LSGPCFEAFPFGTLVQEPVKCEIERLVKDNRRLSIESIELLLLCSQGGIILSRLSGHCCEFLVALALRVGHGVSKGTLCDFIDEFGGTPG
jgi:hypothetical protein